MTSLKNNIVSALFIIVVLSLTYQAQAKMYVQTFVVSGTIAVIRDNIITLDDGISYAPINPDQQLNVSEGQMVSLRYIIDPNGDVKYSEVVAGEGKLKTLPPPEDTRKPKTQL